VGALAANDSVVDWDVVSYVTEDRPGRGSCSEGEKGETDESLHICYLRGAV